MPRTKPPLLETPLRNEHHQQQHQHNGHHEHIHMHILLPHTAHDLLASSLQLSNDTDAASVDLLGVTSITLQFPKFTDGRAYSQAHYLRVRAGFDGELVAWGDVLVDQLPQMHRMGFSHAVLRNDQSLQVALAVLAQFKDYYQGDTHERNPRFASSGTLDTAPTGAVA
jgi:uncharacterized protein (DUF934 family)